MQRKPLIFQCVHIDLCLLVRHQSLHLVPRHTNTAKNQKKTHAVHIKHGRKTICRSHSQRSDLPKILRTICHLKLPNANIIFVTPPSIDTCQKHWKLLLLRRADPSLMKWQRYRNNQKWNPTHIVNQWHWTTIIDMGVQDGGDVYPCWPRLAAIESNAPTFVSQQHTNHSWKWTENGLSPLVEEIKKTTSQPSPQNPQKIEYLRLRATQPEIINHFYSLLKHALDTYHFTGNEIWAAEQGLTTRKW